MKLLLFFSIFIASACTSQSNHENQVQEKLHYDSSKIAIIPYTNDMWFFDSLRFHAANLTQSDIVEIEQIFNQSIAENNSKYSDSIAKLLFTIDLKNDYKRQYVCVANGNNEKIIYVNCFCEAFTNIDWKRYVHHVDDGGSYFHLKINLTTKKYFDLFVNGYG